MVRSLPLFAAALWVVLSAAAPARAQICDLANTFDPTAASALVSGNAVWPGWAYFGSPENGDPAQVWRVGDAGTLDGCVGGVAPGSGLATGKLEIRIDFLFCFGVDVETVSAYTAELFDPGGALVSTVSGNSPAYDLPFNGSTWYGYRVVLTPGTMPGGTRDELCVDNARAVYGEVPVVPRSWGRVKTLYR